MKRLIQSVLVGLLVFGGAGRLAAQDLGGFLDWLHKLSGPRFVGAGLTTSYTFPGEAVNADETVLVVLNTADDATAASCAPPAEGGACMPTSFPPGTLLRDVAPGAEGATFPGRGDGTVEVTGPARGGRVLVP